ncbi:hypothetical protein CLV58_14811 [Spirosoma oryzae]|uniref:Uncharacterized protein n=1 Tax=Spirosoma oryzae TaxID=1469603 RepID=A0A2T0RLC2_9BACT|nr:hypothetical protein [Spirosoma oryzae]PRY21931.1 hypothetical protein CLV58_14811 [Spirosoma oryzae]
MHFPTKRFTIILLVVTGLLSIPLVAMEFTNDVNWSLSDFVIAGFLLFGTGLACEFSLQNIQKTTYRLAICGGLLLLLCLLWLELAVGIFGSPISGN